MHTGRRIACRPSRADADESRPQIPVQRPTFRPARDYIVFALLASAYLLPFLCIMLPRSNEGSIIYGAERIIHGDVFARDFFEVMGPGSLYILAFFFKVLGISFFANRVWLFCSSLGIALCLYFLSRRVSPQHALLPTLIIAGTWFGMQWPSISHHVDSDLFSLVAVVCLVIWNERSYSQMLYVAGICAAITLWIHQPKGVLLFLAISAWCALRPVPGRARIAICARVATAFVSVHVAVSLYFLSQGALRALADANLIWPMRNYTAINAVPYGLGIFSEYWRHWAVLHGNTSWWSIALASILIIPFVFAAALPMILASTAHLVKDQTPSSTSLLCLLAGWSLWLAEIHRMDIYHLAFGCPLLLLVSIGILSGTIQPYIRAGLQILAIVTVCLMTINLLQVVTTPRVDTRVGRVGIFGSDAPLRLIEANTKTGDSIFVYPDCPNYYFLSATRNPTRVSLLIYNYNPAEEFQQVIRTLEQRRVRLVVWDTKFQERTAKSVFPGVKVPEPEMQIMEPYLQARYRQIGVVDGFRILLRND